MNYPRAETWPRIFSIHSFIPLYLILGTKRSKRRREEKRTAAGRKIQRRRRRKRAPSRAWGAFEKAVTRDAKTRASRAWWAQNEAGANDHGAIRGSEGGNTPTRGIPFPPVCNAYKGDEGEQGGRLAYARASARAISVAHVRHARKDFLSSILDARFSRSLRKRNFN